MAIAKVGAFGAVASGSNTVTTITPTFGQATTAGNLLVACVASDVQVTGWTATAGWTKATEEASNIGFGSVAIFYKANCGASEANPTFTSPATASTIWGVLSEWSGAAPSSPLDQSGVVTGGVTPQAVAATANDNNASDLAVVVNCWATSKSATATFTESWTPTGGTAFIIGGTGATKAFNWMNVTAYLLGGHGGGAVDQNSESITVGSGGTINSGAACIASFLPVSTARRRTIIGQSIKRSSLY